MEFSKYQLGIIYLHTFENPTMYLAASLEFHIYLLGQLCPFSCLSIQVFQILICPLKVIQGSNSTEVSDLPLKQMGLGIGMLGRLGHKYLVVELGLQQEALLNKDLACLCVCIMLNMGEVDATEIEILH